MTDHDLDLLRQFTGGQSQDAFTTLVNRHVNLVFSAALRQVRSPQLAEEVSQSVFADLANQAGQLQSDTILTAWLYQVTRRTAIDVVRREARRQLREQIATEMNAMNASTADWEHIEPFLDEAMHALDDTDRTAVLLRYFENKSLREVGEAIGVGDDAAQKRVSRAVDRLREFFTKRGVTIGASGLTILVSANAVQSAPAGLAAGIAATTASAAVISTSTVIAATKTIAMTTLQKIVIVAALATAVSAGLFEARQNSRLRDQLETLQQQQAPLAEQIRQLEQQNTDATNRLALMGAKLASQPKTPNEVLKLRGEVGRLKQENAIVGGKSALNKLTADPQTRKFLRDQQKSGMTVIYADLVKRMNLTPDQADKFHDLLADHVMDNIDLITQALHDKDTPDQLDQIFSNADDAFLQKIQAALGDSGMTQYQDYTKNLLGLLTAEQFKDSLTGDAAAKTAKDDQLSQLVQQQTQAALAAANLPANYQALPILNFRDFASETEADQNLNLMDTIYANVAAQAGSFLSPDELAKFQAFRTNAISNSRNALNMNRQLMAPISQ